MNQIQERQYSADIPGSLEDSRGYAPQEDASYACPLCFWIASVTLVAALLTGCANNERRMPVLPGSLLSVNNADRAIEGDDKALQIRWFGTACYALQLGELSIVLDPFISTGLTFPGVFVSREEAVGRVFAPLKPEPRAIFVNHTHFDHFLDADEALSTWRDATLYGSQSAVNILHGFGLHKRAVNVAGADRTGRSQMSGVISRGQHSVRYQAFRTEHTPHFRNSLLEVTLLDGLVPEPLPEPPRFLDYKAGEVYNYLFEFTRKKARAGADSNARQETDSHRSSPTGPRKLTVFYLGSPYHFDPARLPADTPIDVLIMLVPSAQNVESYPDLWLDHLRPGHIVLSHYDNALQRDSADKVLFAADLIGVLRDVQRAAAKNGFERIYVPSIAEPSPGVSGPSGRRDTAIRIPFDP